MVSGQEPETSPAAGDGRPALDRRRDDQGRTLAAIHLLEAALNAAAPGREATWSQEVLAALRTLGEATTVEADNAARPDSLLSDIALGQPRLRHRVHGVRAQYRQLAAALTALGDELESGDAAVDVPDVRQRLGWLLTALRYQRARESDLIYEALETALGDDEPSV
ncbi:MAG: hypothetical protein JWN29_2751 [Acidimicrobiales bacterium]|nr:hypothetical protein [Acidimicrobiales bacterium]